MPSQVFSEVFGKAFFLEEQATAAADLELLRKWVSIRIPDGYEAQESIAKQSDNCHTAYVLLTETTARFGGIIESFSGGYDTLQADRMRSNAQASFAHNLPLHKLEQVLSFVLYVVGSRILKLDLGPSFNLTGVPDQADEAQLYSLLTDFAFEFREVGLAGDQAARAYARAIDNLLDLMIRRRMWVQTSRGSDSDMSATAKIYQDNFREIELRIVNEFTPFIQRILYPMQSFQVDDLGPEDGVNVKANKMSSWNPTQQSWIDRGKEKMAKLMSKRLYGFIVGGFLDTETDLATDLAGVASTPTARGYMATELQKQLAFNLLHAGSSTVHVLDAYISFIWALRRIDPTGVLLVRIAHDITNFLHTRDDAVRIVILSLLEAGQTGIGEALPSGEKFSGMIAKVMSDAIKADAVFGKAYYPGKDLKDEMWEPEPVDAFTGYRSARYKDTMGHIVTIKDKDVFIEELRSILGERLLKSDDLNPWKEVRLLEMFKDRFEDFPIRECEIMVKDMQDSYNYFRSANKNRKSLQEVQDFQVKVLSHTYWPALRDEKFNLPTSMKHQIDEYSRKFQLMKPYRQLDWIDAQGHVTVELELEDRTVTEEVTAWQAAVIYQFDEDEMGRVSSAQPGTRSIADIEATTQMDEDLIRSALTFWVGKLVLLESVSYPDAYTVLEKLSASSTASTNEEHLGALSSIAAAAAVAAQQAENEAAAAELKTVADLFVENEALYTNFVVSMLMNQGHMPASRMMMMLKMLLTGGFPFEEVDFVEFLQGLAEAGKIERAGGLWMVKK